MRVPRPFTNRTPSGFELRSRQNVESQGVVADEQDDPDYKGDAGITGTYHSVHLPGTSPLNGIRVDVAQAVEYR